MPPTTEPSEMPNIQTFNKTPSTQGMTLSCDGILILIRFNNKMPTVVLGRSPLPWDKCSFASALGCHVLSCYSTSAPTISLHLSSPPHPPSCLPHSFCVSPRRPSLVAVGPRVSLTGDWTCLISALQWTGGRYGLPTDHPYRASRACREACHWIFQTEIDIQEHLNTPSEWVESSQVAHTNGARLGRCLTVNFDFNLASLHLQTSRKGIACLS
jgi:hypothetical protein